MDKRVEQQNSQYRFDLPAELHKKLKTEAAMRGISMRDLVIKAIKNEILFDLKDKKGE